MAEARGAGPQVRQALARGKLGLVENWLGRPHVLVAHLSPTTQPPTGQEMLR